MLLAVDIGNTRVNFCLMERGVVQQRASHPSNERQSVSHWRDFFHTTFSNFQEWDVLISSVVPSLDQTLIRSLKDLGARDIKGLSDLSLPLEIDTLDPIGDDLVATAIGALTEYTPPFLILDLGTATTLAYIDKLGTFQGVSIAPGAESTLKALTQSADLLPSIKLEKPHTFFGKDTVSCLRSGMYHGFGGLYNGLIKIGLNELVGKDSGKVQVIATGGLTHYFKDILDRVDFIDDHLIFKGLNKIYNYNKNHLEKSFRI